MPRAVRMEFPRGPLSCNERAEIGEKLSSWTTPTQGGSSRLGEALSMRSWRVHAFSLMSNHFHLVLETPEAKLSRECDGCRNLYGEVQHAAPISWAFLCRRLQGDPGGPVILVLRGRATISISIPCGQDCGASAEDGPSPPGAVCRLSSGPARKAPLVEGGRAL